jgi:hypothetical protein
MYVQNIEEIRHISTNQVCLQLGKTYEVLEIVENPGDHFGNSLADGTWYKLVETGENMLHHSKYFRVVSTFNTFRFFR